MKIGKLPRKLVDYSRHRPISKWEMQIMILLCDVMWMGMSDIRHNLVVANPTVVKSLRNLNKRHLVKIARRECSQQGLDRKYTITQKGRNVVNDFFNYLNED